MIKIKVLDILEKRERNILWLSKKTDISYPTLYNFVMGKTNAVSYSMLETICKFLECKLTDILEIVED